MSAQLKCPSCEARFKVPADAIKVEGRTVRCSKCKYKWNATRADLIFPEADAVLEQAEEKKSESDIKESIIQNSEKTVLEKKDNDNKEKEPVLEEEVPINNTIAPEDFAVDDDKQKEIVKAEEMAQKLAKNKKQKPKRLKKPRKKLSEKQITKRLIVSSSLMGVLFVSTAFMSWRDGIRQIMPFTESVYSTFGYPSSDDVKLANLKLSRINLNKRTRYIISGSLVNTSSEPRAFPTLHVRLVDKDGKQLRALEGAEPRILKAGETFSFSPSIDSLLSRTEQTILIEIGNDLELSGRE